jgi:tRNA threonylcarbamoyladenosine biosynthesis protein TsaB
MENRFQRASTSGGRGSTGFAGEESDARLILAVDNSMDLLNIAVAEEGTLLVKEHVQTSTVPSEIIADAVLKVLTDCGHTIDDISAIFVTLGPGSFTGIRVSLAFCKGIASAKNIPLIGVPTLDVLAQSLSHKDGNFLCPIIDAKKSEVFLSLYYASKGELKKFINERAVKPETVPEIIQKPCICFGTGITVCEPFLNGAEGVTIEKNAYQKITAGALIKTGIDIMKNSINHDTKLIYGRKSEAEIKFNVTVD